MSNESHRIHEQNWELLPWLVNGSLPVDQIEAVERHVGGCEVCAAEVKALQKLKAQMRANGALLLAPQTSWQKMNERLDREDELLSGNAPAALQTGSFLALRNGRGWQALAAAQMLVILGLVVSVVWTRSAEDPRVAETNATLAPYGTLTSPDSSSAPTVTVLRVVFHRDAAIGEVSALLRETSVQVLGGPSEAGVYTLRANESVALPQLLDRLRADARVVFAEPQQVAP
jgi:hypothetical protein